MIERDRVRENQSSPSVGQHTDQSDRSFKMLISVEATKVLREYSYLINPVFPASSEIGVWDSWLPWNRRCAMAHQSDHSNLFVLKHGAKCQSLQRALLSLCPGAQRLSRQCIGRNLPRTILSKPSSILLCLPGCSLSNAAFQVPNQAFVSTILFDCIRHSTLLRTITNIFYATEGLRVRRSEENIYKGIRDRHEVIAESDRFVAVIVYLILFQLDTAGLELVRGFIRSVDVTRMHQVTSNVRSLRWHRIVSQFLKFFLDDTHLENIQKECMKIYEQDYIEGKIGRVMKT